MARPMGYASVRGLTLVEILISSGIFSFMILVMAVTLTSSWGVFDSGVTRAGLQEEAREIIDRITEKLKQSGRAEGLYPYIFEDGYAEGIFSDYYHEPAVHDAEEGSMAFGPTREIVFKCVADNDGDGYPTDATTGAIEWGDDEYAIVLETNDRGENELLLLVNGVTSEILGTDVERIDFEDHTVDTELPISQMRITVHLRRSTHDRMVRYSLNSAIMMRNCEGL